MAQDFVPHEKALTVADEAQVSGSFQPDRDSVFFGVYIPDIDACTVGIEVSRDNSTFIPILDPADGQDLVILDTGQDPGFVDISDFMRSVSPDYYVRFTFSAAQNGGPYTLYLIQRK